jgi:hypothetical protein
MTVLFFLRTISMRIITPRKAAVITICCVPIIFVYIALPHQDDPDDIKAKYMPR